MQNLEIREPELNLTNVQMGQEGSTLDKSDRRAVRGVVINCQNKVALLWVKKYQYHKLPGGGIEINEDEKQALGREILEETGCQVQIESPLGTIIEHRTHYQQYQTSTAYIARTSNDISPSSPQFTDLETAEGFVLKWVPLLEAVQTLKTEV